MLGAWLAAPHRAHCSQSVDACDIPGHSSTVLRSPHPLDQAEQVITSMAVWLLRRL